MLLHQLVIRFCHRVGNAHRSEDSINLHHNSSFFVGSGKGSKGFKTFSKSKDACVFPFNATFQFRWNNGGSAAGSAVALEEPRKSVQAAAAIDCSVVEAPLCCGCGCDSFGSESSALATGAAGDATIVLGNISGCACAATDSLDATNSKGMGNNTFASAFREFDIDEVSNSKNHREVTSVQGDTGSTAFSLMHHSPIRDCRPNSLHHPIHACAHSRLEKCGVGSGGEGGVGACAGVSCVVSSGVVDDVDDACMDGSALDGIRVGSNSVIQSFSEYHDSSCARLNALQKSHLECGRHVCGGMKRSSTGSLCKVRLSVGKNVLFPAAVKKSAW